MQIPLTFWDMSIAVAVTAITLHITFELSSPYYGRTKLSFNKKRLRRATLVMGILFIITVVVRIYISVS